MGTLAGIGIWTLMISLWLAISVGAIDGLLRLRNSWERKPYQGHTAYRAAQTLVIFVAVFLSYIIFQLLG